MSKVVYFPLSSSFTAISIVGIFVSIYYVANISTAWGFAFAFLFAIMFIASIISMSKAQPIASHMNELAIHEPGRRRKIEKEIPDRKLTKFIPKWYDALFIVFCVVALVFVWRLLTFSTALVDPVWFIMVMAIYITLLIFMIVDVLSYEALGGFWQIVNIFLLLLLGPVTMFFYYFYRRTHK